MARARMRVVRWSPERFIRAIDGALGQRMELATAYVERDIERSMQGGGTPHVPSRPGEPPHVDTGELRRSLHHEVIVKNHVVRGYVIAGAPYATALEKGNPPGNLLPRPFMNPGLKRSQPAIVRILIGKPIGSYLSLGDIRTAQSRGFVSRSGGAR